MSTKQEQLEKDIMAMIAKYERERMLERLQRGKQAAKKRRAAEKGQE